MFRLLSAGIQCRRKLSQLICTEAFRLTKEWDKTRFDFNGLSLGSSYECIAAVQKKYTGDGIASAIDVDLAVCGATESDQLDDIVDLAYKLRHTENTAHMLASTEYALIRILADHDHMDLLFKILNDPINYGIFLNEHSACLLIYHLLQHDRIDGAMKVASMVMVQEMFSSHFLNMLCTFAVLKWIELPKHERILCETYNPIPKESEEVAEEDIKVFRFPYLKNASKQEHFDVIKPDELAVRALMWFSYHLPLDRSLLNSIRLIGLTLRGDFDGAVSLLSSRYILSTTIDLCLSIIDDFIDDNENREKCPTGSYDKLKNSLAQYASKNSMESLCNILKQEIVVMKDHELQLIDEQLARFQKWEENRRFMISSQVERFNLKIESEKLAKELKEIGEEKEMMYFFENRLKWEDMAMEKTEYLSRFSDETLSQLEAEAKYSKELFEKTRKRSNLEPK